MARDKRWIVGVVLVLGAGIGASYVWYAEAESECLEADRSTADLFDRHELVKSLTVLDEVDARCDCARFTSGDEPPQVAIARASLRQLRREGRGNEAREVLARARGPILKDLARRGDAGD